MLGKNYSPKICFAVLLLFLVFSCAIAAAATDKTNTMCSAFEAQKKLPNSPKWAYACGWGAGSGTIEDPIRIGNCNFLQKINDNLSAHYMIVRDIDCTGIAFNPIGQFTGSVDGQSHSITGININLPETSHVGLFSETVSGAQISNISLFETSIVGNQYVGGLVAFNRGTITNCGVSGIVSGNGRSVGGLVGRNENGTITDCSAAGTVSGGNYTGGLIGDSLYGSITKCSFSGSVDGTRAPFGSIGGLVGWNYGLVEKSYSSGTVAGTDQVGGLFGYGLGVGLKGKNAIDCYSLSSVSGKNYVGGLIGMADGNTVNSYSSGYVTGTQYVGGLIGSGYSSCSGSYWDLGTSGQSTSRCGIGLTTAQMKDRNNFSGWDFISIWDGGLGNYPFLR